MLKFKIKTCISVNLEILYNLSCNLKCVPVGYDLAIDYRAKFHIKSSVADHIQDSSVIRQHAHAVVNPFHVFLEDHPIPVLYDLV